MMELTEASDIPGGKENWDPPRDTARSECFFYFCYLGSKTRAACLSYHHSFSFIFRSLVVA